MASSSSIRTTINKKKNQRKVLKERKADLTRIRTRLNEEFDDDVSTARKYSEKTAEYLSGGLSGSSLSVASIVCDIEAVRERAVWSERRLSSAEQSIEQEISRCQTEISNLDAQIARLEAEYEAAKERERRAALAALGL